MREMHYVYTTDKAVSDITSIYGDRQCDPINGATAIQVNATLFRLGYEIPVSLGYDIPFNLGQNIPVSLGYGIPFDISDTKTSAPVDHLLLKCIHAEVGCTK